MPTLPSPPSDQSSSLDRSSCCSGVLPNYLYDIDYVAEDEILSILNVPPGELGRVIRRKGAFIQSVKEALLKSLSVVQRGLLIRCISLGL